VHPVNIDSDDACVCTAALVQEIMRFAEVVLDLWQEACASVPLRFLAKRLHDPYSASSGAFSSMQQGVGSALR